MGGGIATDQTPVQMQNPQHPTHMKETLYLGLPFHNHHNYLQHSAKNQASHLLLDTLSRFHNTAVRR